MQSVWPLLSILYMWLIIYRNKLQLLHNSGEKTKGTSTPAFEDVEISIDETSDKLAGVEIEEGNFVSFRYYGGQHDVALNPKVSIRYSHLRYIFVLFAIWCYDKQLISNRYSRWGMTFTAGSNWCMISSARVCSHPHLPSSPLSFLSISFFFFFLRIHHMQWQNEYGHLHSNIVVGPKTSEPYLTHSLQGVDLIPLFPITGIHGNEETFL